MKRGFEVIPESMYGWQSFDENENIQNITLAGVEKKQR